MHHFMGVSEVGLPIGTKVAFLVVINLVSNKNVTGIFTFNFVLVQVWPPTQFINFTFVPVHFR